MATVGASSERSPQKSREGWILIASGCKLILLRVDALNRRLPLVAEIFLLLLSFPFAAAWLDFELRPRTLQFSLVTAEIRPETGRAYVALIPKANLSKLVEIATDLPRSPYASSLELYEERRLLGPSHSSHNDIRNDGQGAYSHWEGLLYFSTSDGTSPLTNGRSYLLIAPLTPTFLLQLLGLSALLITLWRGVLILPPNPQRAALTAIRRTCRWLAAPAQLGGHWIISWTIVLALVGACWYYLIGVWGSSKTGNFAVADFFQVSDASNYAVCASRVLDDGVAGLRVAEYGGGWCLRRPIYATFLATILGLTGRNWLWTLLIQSALVGLSIAVLLRAVSRLAGLITALPVLWLMFTFSMEHVFPFTMTESAGLALGAVGLALLLDATRVADRRLLFLGTSCLSIALNARAGALFVLPFIVIAVFFQSTSWRSQLSSAAVAIAGIASGFVAHLFLVVYFGGAASASNGSFAYTLYGLSVGGGGWRQIMTDHPEIFQGRSDTEIARLIFDLAWSNVASSPLLIANVLQQNLFYYLDDPLLGMIRSQLLPLGLWWLGALAIARLWREPPYRVIALISIGVLLSSSFIVQDGGPRVFAATWGVTALQVGLGLHLLLSWLWKAVDPEYAAANFQQLRCHRFDVATAVFLLAAVFAPLTPIRYLTSLHPVPPRGCANGQRELIARLGHESYMIVLVGDGQPKNQWRMQVLDSELRRAFRGDWFTKGFAELPVPATVIHGYQIMAPVPPSRFGDDVRLVWHGDLGRLFGKTVSFCFQPDKTVPVTDATYYVARTVRQIEP